MSSPDSASVPSLEVDSRLGKFLLQKLLGEGGMGMVWLAEDTSLGRNVALKVIRPEFALRDDVRSRFVQEARSAAQVEHERIVRVHEVGEDRKVPFIAMELLKGHDLAHLLQNEPVPPLQTTVKIVGQVLQGLSAAHTHPNRLIHRDIKPQNIWLETVEGKTKFRCKILDFGIAKTSAEDRHQTQTGMVIGTLDYMSPEQLNADELDPRSDLFSVGVMFYQMLTGSLPYRSRSAYQRGMEIHTTKPSHPCDLNAKIPRAVGDFALRLMAVKRDDRPGTAKEAIQLLETIIKTPPVAKSGTQPMLVPDWVLPGKPLSEPEASATEKPNPSRTLPAPTRSRTTTSPPSRTPKWVYAVAGVVLLGGLIVAFGLGGSSGGSSSSQAEPEKKEPIPEVVKKEPVPEVKKEPDRLDCTGEKGADAATVKRVQKEWADHLKMPVEVVVELGDGLKMEFVLVPPAEFMMGSPESETESNDNMRPVHRVRLTKPFYLGKYEVTQGEYMQLTGLPNPSTFFRDANWKRHPVEKVSWNDAVATAEKLAKKPLPPRFGKVRLPTEAEWEYAARAGTRTPFHFGESLYGKEANCNGEHPYGTMEQGVKNRLTLAVGRFPPNALGLFEMHGNVWEWCQDGWEDFSYRAEGRIDPESRVTSIMRPMRGGSWYFGAKFCRSSERRRADVNYTFYDVGFRLVLAME